MSDGASAEWKEVCFERYKCEEGDVDCIQKAEIECLQARVDCLTKALKVVLRTGESGRAWEIAENALKDCGGE